MTLAGWIGVGAASGLVTGILGGAACGVLEPLGKAYVMLLESVVYPYLISSLMHGLGRLSPAMALRLFKKSWPFYLAVWFGTLGIIYLLSLAFPSPPPILVDAAAAVRSGPDFLQLILPGNIFQDLDRNYVPAVVMLSVLFGVAIQGIDDKAHVLKILVIVRTACVKIWNWVVKLAPVAVFAMFAVTAGTTRVDQAGGLAVYVVLFLGACWLLAFFALPAVITALIPVRYRDVMTDLRNALTLALVTTLSVVALPYIQQAAEKLAAAHGIENEDRREIIETSLAINYPLGQLGNFFVFFFILFSVFYTRTPLGTGESAALPLMTLFSCFGSPTSTVSAVDFLGSWLQLPGHPTDLYVETMMITRYGQVALSVMGFAFLTYLMTFGYYGRISLRPARMAAALAVTVAVVGGLAAAGHAVLTHVVNAPRDAYLDFTLPEGAEKGLDVTVFPSRGEYLRAAPRPDLGPGETVLARIQRTQTLRVGYAHDIMPFAYRNRPGDLVGYDVACVYDLARTLNVKVVFVPVEFNKVPEDVGSGLMDMWAGGVYVTAPRMLIGRLSQPYYQSPMALIVSSGSIDRVLDMAAIRNDPAFTLAVLDSPTARTLGDRLFPGARKITVPSYSVLPARTGWDGALWTLEQSAVWASGHPGYSAVRPKHMGAVVVFAYMMPKRAEQFHQYINHWIDMRKADGFLARQRAYWIDGAINGGVHGPGPS